MLGWAGGEGKEWLVCDKTVVRSPVFQNTFLHGRTFPSHTPPQPLPGGDGGPSSQLLRSVHLPCSFSPDPLHREPEEILPLSKFPSLGPKDHGGTSHVPVVASRTFPLTHRLSGSRSHQALGKGLASWGSGTAFIQWRNLVGKEDLI